MDKRVLVTDLQPRHPPLLHIWMFGICDVNATPPTQFAHVAMIEILQAMQIMQVPNERRFLAVDFQRVEGFVAAGITRCFCLLYTSDAADE